MPNLDRSHRLQGLRRTHRPTLLPATPAQGLIKPLKLTGSQRALMFVLIRAIEEHPHGLTAEALSKAAGLPLVDTHRALADLPDLLSQARYPFPLTKSPRLKTQGAPRFRLNNQVS